MTRVGLAESLTELKLRSLLDTQSWALVCDEPFRALFEGWGIDPGKLISVDTLDAGVSEATSKFAVVCTEKPEGPVQQRLRDHGMQSIGLFSQVVPRLAAGLSPRYHPRPDQVVKLEYAIMCLPRCGSTLVSRELKQAGAGNPVEHFRGYVQDLLREREASRFDFQRWWDMVRSGHNINGIFGTKIIYDFWKMAERFMQQDEIEVIYDFLKSVPVIYIEREDKYGQAASDTLARQTGVWHIWSDAMKEQYAHKVEGLDGNIQDAIASYKKFRRSERDLEALLEVRAGRVIHVKYDDLVAAPKQTMARVLKELGLDPPPGYMTAPLQLEPTTTEAHAALSARLRKELS